MMLLSFVSSYFKRNSKLLLAKFQYPQNAASNKFKALTKLNFQYQYR